MEQLRSIVAPPHAAALRKERTALDEQSADFIERSPFVLIGSTNGGDITDVSPRGGAPGFVRVLDHVTLAIPDHRGNRRLDTFQNVLAHPVVGLLFLCPGDGNTLRVRGRASIVHDPHLSESMANDGDVPELVLVVRISSLFLHCATSIKRSGLWASSTAGELDCNDLTH